MAIKRNLLAPPDVDTVPAPDLRDPTLPCTRRVALRPTNTRNDRAVLTMTGNAFKIVSGAVGSDMIFVSTPRQPFSGVTDDTDEGRRNPIAVTNLANGEWYPMCFERLEYLWVDDHGTTAPLVPVVLEIALNDHVVSGVAGMGAGAFWEECLTRGNDVAIGNDAGGYVLYTDNPNSAGPFAQSAAVNRRGRCHWLREPYLSYRGTIDGGVGAAAGIDWSIGFFQWDGTAMQLFRVLSESDLVFATETSTGQMCISPAPIGGFEIRAVSDEAGTGGPAGTGAINLSWAFGVRGGMRL